MPFFQTPHAYSLHYELHGGGPEKVLLIMGFACCKAYWGPLVERLLDWGSAGSSEANPDCSSSRYQICCFDSRGFGLSGDSLCRYSSSSLARDCKALLMHLGWIRPERAELSIDLQANRAREAAFIAATASGSTFVPPPLHLCGWSMGGMCCTELTLELARWAAELVRTQAAPNVVAVMDLRSSVIVSSSRGGFTHRADKHDAPVMSVGSSGEMTLQSTESSAGPAALLSATLAPASLLKRFLFRSSVGRWGWGRTWLLRNLPPASGLWRIFRCVFLSLYHSRIERVLELHYSEQFLAEPFQQPETKKPTRNNTSLAGSHARTASLPSAAALSHLPQASAALTSAAASTIEIRRDAANPGQFVWSQEEDASPRPADIASSACAGSNGDTAADNDDDPEDDAEEEDTRQEQLVDFEPKDLEGGESLYLTPAQKRRVVQRQHETDGSPGEDQPASAAADGVVAADGDFSPLSRRRRSLTSNAFAALASPAPAPAPAPATPTVAPAAWPNSFNATLTTPPPVLSRTLSTASSVSSSRPQVLTNRDVLSSEYLLRAPFDRWIVLYAFALFGHGLTCLTHHVSRARIADFMRQQRALAKTLRHPLRMLVITGSADILVHPSNSYHLSEQFQCPLYVLENKGHMIHCEAPDAFAQLLHAHFQRTTIQHLQAYMHQMPSTRASTPRAGGQAEATAGSAASATPGATPLFSPQLSRLESDPSRSRLLVTRMDDGATQADVGAAAAAAFSDSVAAASSASSLSLHDRAELAAHGGSVSRRHSFLVQIDDSGINPLLSRADSVASLAGSVAGDFPSAVGASPPHPPSHHLRRRSHVSSSSTSSLSSLSDPFLQRTPSLREMQRDRSQRRHANCCVRTMVRITSLPLSTAMACSAMMMAMPRQVLQHALHPSLVLTLPTRLFGAFKRAIGGAVLQRPEPSVSSTDDVLSFDADLPVARITTS